MPSEGLTAHEKVLELLRGETMGYLSMCTEGQKSLFNRIYPNGIGSLTEEQLKSAHDLCMRTIHNNINGRD